MKDRGVKNGRTPALGATGARAGAGSARARGGCEVMPSACHPKTSWLSPIWTLIDGLSFCASVPVGWPFASRVQITGDYLPGVGRTAGEGAGRKNSQKVPEQERRGHTGGVASAD